MASLTFDENNLTINFGKVDPQGIGDYEYAVHELAHFVVLFRRVPRRSEVEFEDMQMVLDTMTCGRAQLHELRVLKLQNIVLKMPMKALLESVWSGILNAGYQLNRGQKEIVTSMSKGLRLMRDIEVSPRLVAAYKHTLEKFS
jgi:hypothetical protein